MSVLDYLGRQIASLKDALEKTPSLHWATVTISNPLAIRLDGDTHALAGVVNLAAELKVGDRVAILMTNRRAIVLGAIGGNVTPLIPTDNKVIINGREYQASGVFASIPTPYHTDEKPPNYHGQYAFPTPYTPPPGYGFIVSFLQGNGWPLGLHVFNQNSSTIYVRFSQSGSKSLSLQRVGWQLVRI